VLPTITSTTTLESDYVPDRLVYVLLLACDFLYPALDHALDHDSTITEETSVLNTI
jgi:uncharacterized membrane protein